MKKKIIRMICAVLLMAFCMTALAEDRSNVNRWLGTLGYLDNAAEASAEDIAQALENFQRANGLKVTGEADPDTLQVLLSEKAVSKKDYVASFASAYKDRMLPAYGNAGDEVRMMQSALQDLGYFSGNCDGVFGAATESAVRRFQLANGLTVDGIASEALCLRLYDDSIQPLDSFIDTLPAAPGDERDTVKTLQLWLKELGLFTGECTGRYGRFTTNAVMSYQAMKKIEQTGVADRATARMLFDDMADAGTGGIQADIAAIGTRLNELGYAAHDAMDLQTELAVMRFCKEAGLPVNAALTKEVLKALESEDAPVSVGSENVPEIDDEARLQIEAAARSLLGQAVSFDASYELVRYAYMKCGVDLPGAQALQVDPLEDVTDCRAGDIILVKVGSAQVYGVATEDRAVVFCANNGYIVMRYLSAINADMIAVCRPPVEG